VEEEKLEEEEAFLYKELLNPQEEDSAEAILLVEHVEDIEEELGTNTSLPNTEETCLID